jgi:hypothetical protein
MSIWGKKVDAWFDRGGDAPSRDDYNSAARNALVWIALIALVLLAVFALDRADDGSLGSLGEQSHAVPGL